MWCRLTCLIAVALSLSCVTTGPGGKTSLVIIPTDQEVALGQAMAQEIAATEKEYPDPQWQVYLTEVGQRLVAICDRKDIKYKFTVIESDQINAFAAPGGYIYFYTGLLGLMDNEAELAAVMAHELSHVVARHGAKRLQTAMGAALAYELVMGDTKSETFKTAVGIGMSLLFADYSRDAEREADDFGLTYMIRAGYDPGAMETMFEKLAASGSPSNAFERLVSTHPEAQERIRNTKTAVARKKPLPPNLTLGREKYQQMKSRLPR
ncbi:MAG: M48 family metallopeptidase [Candidatus Zixiibacteriota bacterium]